MERIESKRRRRIMKDFRITEISACDRPAQHHAVVALMKRDDGDDERRPAALKNIQLSELSLVDKPANPHAKVVLFKRAEQQEYDDMMQLQKIGDDSVASFSTLDEAVATIAAIESCGKLEAMQKAARARPDLVRKYNAEGEAIAKQVQRVPTTPKEVVRFDEAVRGIMTRDNCDRLTAMQTVVREQPRLYHEYQAAGATPSDQGLRPAGAIAV